MNKRNLYRTAVVKQHVVTFNGRTSAGTVRFNGVQDLSAGTVVGVRYMGIRPTQLYKQDEPMYEISLNGRTWGYLYERNLTSFVL